MAGLFPRPARVVVPGAVHLPNWLDPERQRVLAGACQRWGDEAGGFRAPKLPRRGQMSVGITCLGWHWLPYRYSRTVDDGDGRKVPPFPGWLGTWSKEALEAAAAVEEEAVEEGAGASFVADQDRDGTPETGPIGCHGPLAGEVAGFAPDVALVNRYTPGSSMGLHADKDEASWAPVVSFSLGDSAVFRFGNTTNRSRPWQDITLESGDLFVFGGPVRRAYHGVTKVLPGTLDASLGLDLPPGRFNVTVRQSGFE